MTLSQLLANKALLTQVSMREWDAATGQPLVQFTHWQSGSGGAFPAPGLHLMSKWQLPTGRHRPSPACLPAPAPLPLCQILDAHTATPVFATSYWPASGTKVVNAVLAGRKLVVRGQLQQQTQRSTGAAAGVAAARAADAAQPPSRRAVPAAPMSAAGLLPWWASLSPHAMPMYWLIDLLACVYVLGCCALQLKIDMDRNFDVLGFVVNAEVGGCARLAGWGWGCRCGIGGLRAGCTGRGERSCPEGLPREDRRAAGGIGVANGGECWGNTCIVQACSLAVDCSIDAATLMTTPSSPPPAWSLLCDLLSSPLCELAPVAPKATPRCSHGFSPSCLTTLCVPPAAAPTPGAAVVLQDQPAVRQGHHARCRRCECVSAVSSMVCSGQLST